MLAVQGAVVAHVPDRFDQEVSAVVATSRLRAVQESLNTREWRRVGGMGAFVLLLHVVGFGILGLLVVPSHYHVGGGLFGFGTGILAYTLGLRHAFDADHIAAIDNSTRKLMADGKRPLSVGFFFSLGHSSVVFLLAVLLNFGIKALIGQVKNDNSSLHHYTGLVGTSVSGFFLFVIAALNIVVLVALVRVFVNMRRGGYSDEELERQLDSRGLMNRILGPLSKRADTPWKMYPIGILFGLGFDTATEIALLVLAGGAVAGGLPFYAILCLPVLFAAGMCLLDTIDGSFMNFAYGWAFSRPVRKVYYNLVITGLSVAVALFIGTFELLSILGNELNLSGGIWDLTANFNLNRAGFFIVGLFVITWVVALGVWRFGRVEARWEESAARARRHPQPEMEQV